MKFYVKFILLTLVCMAHCVALDVIVREDSARHSKFIKDKRDATIFGHTQTGHTVLAEERRVGGTATDVQRKQVFQFIAGTRIIDGGIEANGQRVIADFTHTVRNQVLANHFKIIQLVDQISQAFVLNVKASGHGSNLTDNRLAELTQLSGVSSALFIDWFNESLEKHYVEFMFFGGADVGTSSVGGRIDRQWFKTVQAQFLARATSVQTCKNGEVQQTWISKNGIPFAIYKPSRTGSSKRRNIYTECLSGLCAKAMNIDDVVNRVIPVYVAGSAMTFDFEYSTGHNRAISWFFRILNFRRR